MKQPAGPLDYFGGVLRAAGLATTGAAVHRPAATAGADDPFEVEIETGAAAAPGPDPAAPPRLQPPAQPPGADTAPRHQPPPMAELAREAPPHVEAALRWIAAAEAEPPARAASARPPTSMPAPAPAKTATARETGAASTPTPVESTPLAPPAPRSTAARLPATVLPAPEPPRRIDVEAAPPRSAARLAPPRAADGLARAAAKSPAPAMPAHAATEVHIGTLHVTLDAATTARFAPPRPLPEAAEPPVPGALRAEARPAANSPQAGGLSSLSRSRLPRW